MISFIFFREIASSSRSSGEIFYVFSFLGKKYSYIIAIKKNITITLSSSSLILIGEV